MLISEYNCENQQKKKAVKIVWFVIVKCVNVHILSVSYICSRIFNRKYFQIWNIFFIKKNILHGPFILYIFRPEESFIMYERFIESKEYILFQK